MYANATSCFQYTYALSPQLQIAAWVPPKPLSSQQAKSSRERRREEIGCKERGCCSRQVRLAVDLNKHQRDCANLKPSWSHVLLLKVGAADVTDTCSPRRQHWVLSVCKQNVPPDTNQADTPKRVTRNWRLQSRIQHYCQK